MKKRKIAIITLIGLFLFAACSSTLDLSTTQTDVETILDGEVPTADKMPTDEAQPQKSTMTEEETTTEEQPINEQEVTLTSPLGAMNTLDIYGDKVDGSFFAKNDITLVNVWATWCPPCIAEMPDLAELEKELRDQGVGVLGVVTDVVNNDGTINEETVATAQLITEESGVDFPIVFVDSVLYDELVSDTVAFPTSYFVDSEGNMVGTPYRGAKTKDEWVEVVKAELEAIGE